MRRDAVLVLTVQAVATALVAGWFATGQASAPDDGLQQLDVLSLSELVDGLAAVDGRPTLVAVLRAHAARAVMDVWPGHISLHTGPSPVLVALGWLLLGGAAYLAADLARRRVAAPLAPGPLALVLGACLLARPLATSLADVPLGTAPVAWPTDRREQIPGDNSAVWGLPSSAHWRGGGPNT